MSFLINFMLLLFLFYIAHDMDSSVLYPSPSKFFHNSKSESKYSTPGFPL